MPADAFRTRLAASPLVLDGGLATHLERGGLELDGELWSAECLLDGGEAVRDAHLDFLTAGADCVTAATYQASFEALARRGLSHDEAVLVFRRGVELARQARDLHSAARHPALAPLVAASIGSYGACLADGSEFRGGFGLEVEELVAFHRPRVVAVSEGADVIACETVPELTEVRAFTALAAEIEKPVWISVTLEDGERLRSGEPLLEAWRLVRDSAVAAFALNCSAPQHVTAALERLGCDGSLPVLAYANSGEAWVDGAWAGRREPRPFVEHARDWLDRGAAGVGGCCRVTVEDIRAIADLRARRADGGQARR